MASLRTIRLHAKTVLPYPFDTGPDATVVGPPPQWDDANDATYAISETDSSGTASFRGPMAALDLLPAKAAQIVAVSAHLRYTTEYPDGIAPTLPRIILNLLRADTLAGPSAYSVSTSITGAPTIPNGGGIHEFDWTIWPNPGLDDATNAADGALIASALLDGSVWVPETTKLFSPFRRSRLFIYETWLDVTYLADRRTVRQYPVDNAGLSSAPRIHPPPRTGRIVGGHH